MNSSSIWDRFEAVVRLHGRKPAIVSDGRELTFARLHAAAAGLAAEIASRLPATPGAPPTRVGIVCGRAEHGLAALLALARVRATAVMIDPQRSEAELRARSTTMGCAFHIVDVPGGWTELDILVDSASTTSREALTAPHVRDGTEPYYVLATTGTTAQPKGVLQSERNLAAHIELYARSIELTADDRLTLLPALGTDAGFMDAFSAVLTGATLYPWDVRSAGLNGIIPWLASSRISVVHCTPSLLAAILESNSDAVNLASVRIVVLGGEALHARHLTGFCSLFLPRTRIVNGYGPTECTVVCQAHYGSVEEVIPNNIGRPVPGIDVLIDHGAAPDGEQVGEIIVLADRLALGYTGAGELDSSRFIVIDGRRAYRTGDSGWRTPDGSIRFAGRTDRRIKVRGLFVDCDRVEALLREDVAVREAYVDLDDAGRLVAWVGCVDEQHSLSARLRAQLLERVESHEVPSAIHVVEWLPRTASAKVDVARLRAAIRTLATTASELEAPPGEGLLALVETAVRRRLQVASVSPSQTFFELGGDSLTFLLLVADLDRILGRSTKLALDAAYLSLRDLADRLTHATAPPDDAAEAQSMMLTAPELDFWLSEILGVGLMAPRLHLVVEVDATIDPAALQDALHATLAVIPKLGMRVAIDDHGRPYWRACTDTAPTLEVVSSEGSAGGRWLQSFLDAPLSCVDGPVLRAAIATSASCSQIAVVAHHAYLDGFAIRELVRYWFATYDRCAKPRAFTVDASGLTAEPDLVAATSFLKGATRARYPGQVGASCSTEIGRPSSGVLELPNGVLERLQRAGKIHGQRPFAVWALAFASALERVNGDADTAIPTVVSGRGGDRPADALGCFISTIYVRCRLRPGVRRTEILERFIEDLRPALAIQRIPRQRVHASLGWTDTGVAVPNVFLSYHSWMDDRMAIAGRTTRRLPVRTSDLRVPLSLDVTRLRDNEGIDTVTAVIAYDTARIASHRFDEFRDIFLEELAAWSRVAVAESSEERYPSAWQCNVLVGRSPDEPGTDPVAAFFRQAKRAPERIAMISRGECVAYGELAAEARRFADVLARAGLKAGELAPLSCVNPVDVIIAWLASWTLGAGFVTISDEWPQPRIAEIAAAHGFSALITDRDLQVPNVAPISRHTAEMPVRAWPHSGAQEHEVAYGYFTSGTTGVPRLALVARAGLQNRLAWMARYFEDTTELVTLRTTPFEYDSAIWQVLWPLSTGGSVVIPERHDVLSLERVLDHVSTRRVKVIDFVPSVLSALLTELDGAEHVRERLASLRHVIVGGERVHEESVERLLALLPWVQVTNLYGTTETTIGSVAHRVERGVREVPLGHPIDGTWCAVLDAAQRPLPPGREGEIVLGGACVGLGYVGDEQETTARFGCVPISEASLGRYFRTGDVGMVNDAGHLTYLGRRDHQVKRHGVRIELEGIALAMERDIPNVQAACVVLTTASRLHAFVTGTCTPVDVERWAAERLPPPERPTKVHHVDSLPLTAMGKIDRAALLALAAAADVARPHVDFSAAPESDHSATQDGIEIVRRVWSSLLGIDHLPPERTFFELGGHSLLAVQAASMFSRVIGMRVPVTVLFAYPRASQLASEINRMLRERPANQPEQC